MNNLPTMEEVLKKSPLQSIRDFANQHAIIGNIEYTNRDGSVMTINQLYWSNKREENLLDNMTLQMVEEERTKLTPGETLPEWLKKAESASRQKENF